jgi:outer membrane protein assembly complex protein YaeT
MLEVRLSGLRLGKIPVLIVCAGAVAVPAAVEDYAGRPIASITFAPPVQPFPVSELSEILTLKRNEPLRLADVRSTIERLFATGRYSDVVVDARIENGQVAVQIITSSNWFVGQVLAESSPSPPSPGQLVNATNLNLGTPFYAEDLPRSTANLRQALASNGFFRPKIEPRFSYENRTQQATIQFAIVPEERARFAAPVVRGNQQRPQPKIVSETHWKGWFGWRTVTDSRLQRGLERVLQSYRDRDYLMARVTLDRLDYDAATNSAVPVIQISEGPIVKVEATGAKVSGGRLKQLVPVFEEQAVDRDLLVEGAQQLTEHFQAQGYFDATVDFSLKPAGDGELRIQYAIDRGARHKLREITILGNRYFDLATLKERMYSTPAGLLWMRHGRYSAALLERDMDSIAELYRANGFREVKATSQLQDDYRGKKGDVAVAIRVEEGPQWFVESVEFTGAAKEDEEALRPMLQSAPGQPFSEANVAADRDMILAFYYDRGYANVAFEYGYSEAPGPARMNLRYQIAEGTRRFVREVLINGLQATHPQLVNRRIGINVGDPLSQTRLLDTQRRLYDLGIFAKVETAVQNPDGEEPSKFVVVDLEESKKYSATFGFGAEIARIGGGQSNLASPGGETGFSPRVSFDLTRLNLLGNAHTISFRSRISNLQDRVLVTYGAPQFRGRQNLDLSFTALFDSSRDKRTFSSRRWEVSTQIAQRWTRSKMFFYRFAYRRVSVNEDTLNINKDLIPLLSQPVRVGVFSVGYLDDRRDDPIDSHKGTYNTVDLAVASKLFASETDYLRLLARNSTYHRLGDRLVLARTFSFGLMTTLRNRPELPASPQDIPLPERFYAGGASTHRAFPENQAGPRDEDTGFPLGGKALLAIGTELRFPLIGQNISGVLFHDAGNVFTSVRDISWRFRQRNKLDFDYMVHAAGFGVRYRTPVGPFRVDFAFSPNSPRFSGCRGSRAELLFGDCKVSDQRINRFQFHFSMGQTF